MQSPLSKLIKRNTWKTEAHGVSSSFGRPFVHIGIRYSYPVILFASVSCIYDGFNDGSSSQHNAREEERAVFLGVILSPQTLKSSHFLPITSFVFLH